MVKRALAGEVRAPRMSGRRCESDALISGFQLFARAVDLLDLGLCGTGTPVETARIQRNGNDDDDVSMLVLMWLMPLIDVCCC